MEGGRDITGDPGAGPVRAYLRANIGCKLVPGRGLAVADEIGGADVVDRERQRAGVRVVSATAARCCDAVDFVEPTARSVQVSGRCPVVREGKFRRVEIAYRDHGLAGEIPGQRRPCPGNGEPFSRGERDGDIDIGTVLVQVDGAIWARRRATGAGERVEGVEKVGLGWLGDRDEYNRAGDYSASGKVKTKFRHEHVNKLAILGRSGLPDICRGKYLNYT